jgi:hypothetical protein
VSRGPRARHAPGVEPHVARRVPGRVVDQHEVRDGGARVARDRRERRGERAVVEAGVDVAAHYREGLVAEQRQRLRDPAGGLQRGRLGRVADARAEPRAVAQRLFDHRAEMRVVHDDLGEAAAHQALQLPFDEGAPAGG